MQTELMFYFITTLLIVSTECKNGFLLILDRKQNYADLEGNHLSCTAVSTGSMRSQTVWTEAKYDGQPRQEAKFGRLV